MAAEATHAVLPPSGWYWWWNCAGVLQVPAVEGLPSTPGLAAERGTKGHSIAERVARRARDRKGKDRSRGVKHIWTDADQAEAEALGPDYPEAIQLYVEYILRFPQINPVLEERVYPIGENGLTHGTLDAGLDLETWLEIADLKLGEGEWVPAETLQLKLYALGFLLRVDPQLKRVKKVKCTVVQPRCHRPDKPVIRSVEYDAGELVLDFAWEVESRVAATQVPGAPLKAGAWCRWCPRALNCPLQLENAKRMAQEDFAAPAGKSKDPSWWPRGDLGEILDRLDKIDGWAKNIRELAAELAIVSGVKIPGRKVVVGDTHRKWQPGVVADPAPLAIATGLSMEDLWKPDELRSPAQLEKAAGKGVKLDQFTYKPEGKLQLVPETDERESVVTNSVESARKDFEI